MTPRRILLLMSGLFAFGAVYAIYARAFGWLDGLPILKDEMLVRAEKIYLPPPRPTSPTIDKLKQAFGEHAPETEPAFYPFQLQFRSGETSLVLASGSPPSSPNSNRVTLSPFSIAIFSKPKPAHLLAPGEVNEITTFHADKAVLEFDRTIQSPADMNTAKLIRMELISDPEQAIPDPLKRRGYVHVTNNQRSADPNRFLLLKTVGPMIYRDPKYAKGPDQLGPDVWTDASIEIVDRSNLPRKPGVDAAVAPTASEESRNSTFVASILGGQRLPPPTVTAVGLRIYLDPDDYQTGAKPLKAQAKKEKRGAAGFSGVRRVELLEKVLLHLWMEGGQGTLVGAAGKTGSEPVGLFAVAGGLVPGNQAARESSRDLLQVETRGPFAYDAEKNIARFDVLPQADPNLPNDVRVTKVPARPGIQSLFSQVLEIEFNGAPTGNPPPGPPAVPMAGAATAVPAAGPRFRKLHAWTYTPGRFLTVSSDVDHLEAYGQDLVHEQAAEKTTLTGAPLYAVQQRNVLTAGGAKNPAVLVIEPAPSPPGASPIPPNERRNQATVNGPGRFEMYDAVAKSNTTTATWQKSMVHRKERIDDREVDLFTLTDAARFEDTRADYWLKGNVLKLWLKSAQKSGAVAAGESNSRALPHRVQAIGEVSGHSADMDVEQTDHLIAHFEDVSPPEPGAGPAEPQPPVTPKADGPRKPVEPKAGPAPAEPARPAKPPMKLKARTIETWVARFPAPKAGDTPMVPPVAPNEQAQGGVKYQLKLAHCDGMVSVHQDPEDPTKPRGTDILGSRMVIESTPDGSKLTVHGWDNRPGEVHNEGTSLIGSKIVVDQLHNLAVIEGRGSVAIPSSSGLTGAEPKTAEPVVIHFRDGMTFRGALKIAEFFGKVSATQGGSWVTCHTMRVNFDRPVYFTQSNRPKSPPKGPADDKPKLDIVDCYPAPGDTADSPQEKIVAFTQVERDPETGQTIRRQQIEAQELRLEALALDPEGGETYRRVTAHGPGIVRTWAPGSRDDGSPGPARVAARPPGQPTPPPALMEMKLTVVNFSDRMIAKDKGDRYKEATFREEVQVIHVPTDDPNLEVRRNQLPPRAVLLTCSKNLVVWTRKVNNEAAQQSMHAHGNAYLQNEEYEGWGEVIQSEGRLVRLFGEKDNLARIKSRFGGTEQPGEMITYDRATDHYRVDGSIGGTLITPGTKPTPKSPNRPVPKR
jgi:hypothetical protein